MVIDLNVYIIIDINVVEFDTSLSLLTLYGTRTWSKGTDLTVIAECFTCNTLGTFCNNIYTGEIQTSNYLRICPKMEFLCANDKYCMNVVTKKSKGNAL